MVASARVDISGLAGHIEPHRGTARWRRLLELSTAAGMIAYVVAVGLPRYMLASDLTREIEWLAVRSEQASHGTTSVAQGLPGETQTRLKQFIDPADLLPAATAAGRRAGLHLAAVKQMLPQATRDRARGVRLHATASFDQIVGFLDEIAALSPTLRVDALRILRPATIGAGTVALELECVLSVEPLSPTQAAGAAPEEVE